MYTFRGIGHKIVNKKQVCMSIKYTVKEKKNPLNAEKAGYRYAIAKSTGDVTFKSLGKEISRRCTVTTADTLAVLEGLTQVLSEHLAEGRIVRIGDFGSFRIGIGGEGAIKEELYRPTMIKKKKVLFRSGNDLKELLRNLTFERSES